MDKMIVESTTGKKLTFLEARAGDIYILDHAAFSCKFDLNGKNEWDKSFAKKKLQEWAKATLSDKMLMKFDVDILMLEEIFSQKRLNLNGTTKKLRSRQLSIFKDSDNRMISLNNEPCWWWTRTPYKNLSTCVWAVMPDGDMGCAYVVLELGIVPVLRRKGS